MTIDKSKKIKLINIDLHKRRITDFKGRKIVEHYCIVCGVFHEGHTRQSCFDDWKRYCKNL